MNSLGDPSRDNSVLLEQALYQPLCRLLDIKTKHQQTLPNTADAYPIHPFYPGPVPWQKLTNNRSSNCKLTSSHTPTPLGKGMSLFLSDPSPIIGNACQWLPNWLTNWLDACEWRFGQDFEVDVQAIFWSWSLFIVLLLMLGCGYEVQPWSRFWS